MKRPIVRAETILDGIFADAVAMDWNREDDVRVKGELGRLGQKIDRMRRLKSGGIDCFREYPTIYENLQHILRECKRFGLMLVPVGELEYWSSELMSDGPGKKRKAEWANEAAMRIREAPQRAPDLLRFMQEMAEYQAEEALRLAGA